MGGRYSGLVTIIVPMPAKTVCLMGRGLLDFPTATFIVTDVTDAFGVVPHGLKPAIESDGVSACPASTSASPCNGDCRS